MQETLQDILLDLGHKVTVLEFHRVSGGDINQAFYVKTQSEEYFIKVNEEKPREFFEREAGGLQEIAGTKTVRVPAVFGVSEDSSRSALAMEWIDTRRPTKTSGRKLGEGVAALHCHTGRFFGHQADTFLGGVRQEETWCSSWLEYYRDHRLLPQVERMTGRGHTDTRRLCRLQKLLVNLDRWIPETPKPALLHGDLWGGNWMESIDGQPILIDPNTLHGHHEFELAFTELFGGFSDSFYDAYRSIYPIDTLYEERKPLYQLYYLLVHLNLFGESYGIHVDQVLQYYGG